MSFAVATVLISGVNLFALALVIHLHARAGRSASRSWWPRRVVLVYITLGGLTSAIYNEVLQFFIILAALVPLTIVALHDMGGVSGLSDRVKQSKLGEQGLHAWQGVGIGHTTNPIDANWIAIVFGLGFVLSFGYWTTNFAEVQRALSAKNLSAARRTPLIGAYPKIFIPALTIIPGLVALVLGQGPGRLGPEPPVQQRDPDPHRALPARGHARHRGDRPAGRVHGRRGGERHLVQHGRSPTTCGSPTSSRAVTRSTTCGSGAGRRSGAW